MEDRKITLTQKGAHVKIEGQIFGPEGFGSSFVSKGETVHQYFYQQVFIRLHDRVRRTRRALWSDKSCLLHHDRAPAHNAVSMRQFLVKKQIAALDHPPFSPNLAPCDFWLFPRLKIVIKRTHFSSSEEITASVTKELKSLKQEFAKCFRGWQDRLQKCINSEGEYFEGDNL